MLTYRNGLKQVGCGASPTSRGTRSARRKGAGHALPPRARIVQAVPRSVRHQTQRIGSNDEVLLNRFLVYSRGCFRAHLRWSLALDDRHGIQGLYGQRNLQLADLFEQEEEHAILLIRHALFPAHTPSVLIQHWRQNISWV